MASYRPRKNKFGQIISYEIRVSRGYDPVTRKALKPYTMTWPHPDGWSKNRIERELNKVAAEFETACKRGEVLTNAERKAKAAAEAEEERRKPTFTQYISIFLQEKAEFSPNTRENYSIALQRAAAVFGDMKMADITMTPHAMLDWGTSSNRAT